MADRKSSRQNPTRPGTPKKPGWPERFLEEFAVRGNVLAACEAAGIHRDTAYDLQGRDPEFAAAWKRAKADALDRLALVARERAVDGWDEPVFHQGVACGAIRKYDNGLLWKLMAAHDPETYGSKVQTQHTGKDGGPIEHRVDLTKLTDEQLAALEGIVAASAAESSGDPGGA
jgi:hypothetical protein